MGVTGLWKLIDQSGKPVPLDTLENKVLAVDISIWLHQVVKGFQDSNGATLPHAHLLGLFHRLCKLMYYRIKPVFVFDGGVPPLKRETIAKRARNKYKYQSEADKLQQLLLEALAKEKVVQQALGASTSSLLNNSPKKAIQPAGDEENDLFKLPPMQDEPPKDDSYTDLSEGDGSFDEKQRTHYNLNLHTIDVKSAYFLSLPADIRHEILSDMKETRKQSSWGRLHELPVENQSFSCFQMKKLLKRRQVQVGLEEAEKEMGGKGGLSMAELENLLSEEGVVDPDIATERIASNEHVRYLHVRDITKALKREADEKIKMEELSMIKEENDDEDESKVNEKEEIKDTIKTVDFAAEDIDLQRAIQLSLVGDSAVNDDYGTGEDSELVRLTVEQRKALGSAAHSLARHYMVEYGGLNDEEVSDLVKLDETANITQEFKFNDESVLYGKIETVKTLTTPNFQAKEISKKLNVEAEKPMNMSESSSDEAEISSNADSDFIDVPEIDAEMNDDDSFFARSKFPLPPPFLMNSPPPPKTNLHAVKLNDESDTKIEVVINPDEICSVGDDIFADIFSESDRMEVGNVQKPDDSISLTQQTKDNENMEVEIIEIEDDESEEISKPKQSNRANSPEPPKIEALEIPKPESESSGSKIQSILSGLDNERSAVIMLRLDDLLGTKTDDFHQETVKSDKSSTFLDVLKSKSGEESKNENFMITPTKIPQPFFVKKTPPSSKKKSPESVPIENSMTPSKAVKSLSEAFDSIPSTSSQAISAQESVAMAANVLRENKSKEELEGIAEQLNQERRDLAAERNKKDRLGVSITEQMSMECMELLRLFGVPYVVAPMEAEAQCAYLNEIHLTDGTITDDSDIWLFGGKTVYKNFFDQNKHVLEFKSDNIERLFHLDRQKLIQLSFLVGSDYTQGIHGVGAVTALEVLSVFTATPEKEGETTQTVSIISSLRKFRDWWFTKSSVQRANTLRNKLKNITITEDFPNMRVVEAYLFPTVDENREKFSWGTPEVESLREYAKKTFGWTKMRTDEIILPVVRRLSEKTSQQTIQNYFKITGVTSRQDLKVSKRVRTAIQQMSGEPDSSLMNDEVVEKKKPRKKSPKTAKTSNEKSNEENPNDNDEKVKSKPRRKRKAAKKTEQEKEQSHNDDDDDEPSISMAKSISNGSKKVVLPDNNAPIPQREKDKEIMESNRLKAIAVLKAAKANKNKNK